MKNPQSVSVMESQVKAEAFVNKANIQKIERGQSGRYSFKYVPNVGHVIYYTRGSAPNTEQESERWHSQKH